MVTTPTACAWVMPRSAAISPAIRGFGVGERPVGHADPHGLGQEPLLRVRGELPRNLAERAAGGLGGLGGVGLQVRVAIPAGAGPLDGGDGPLPGGGAAPVTRRQHGGRRRPHPRGQHRLHLGGGRQAENVRDVAGLAGHALHVRAGLGERDDRDEEQGEEATPGALPVLPVAAARAAVERSLAGGAAVSERPFGPDYTVTSLSYVVSLLPQGLVSDLGLARHGYKVFPQGPYFVPYPDGRSLQLPADPSPGRGDQQVLRQGRRRLGEVRGMRGCGSWAAVLGAAPGHGPAQAGQPGAGATSARRARCCGSSARCFPSGAWPT